MGTPRGPGGDTAHGVDTGHRRPRSVAFVFTRLLDAGQPPTGDATLPDDDVRRAVAAERRGGLDRPWVMTNMVSSLDGAIARDDGVSGGLGGAPDGVMFSALRRRADAVVVGAGTARAERYRPLRDGLLVVVTGSGSIDLELPLFTEPGPRPLVVTGSRADADALDRLRTVADVVVVDHERVPPAAVIDVVAARGIDVVLLEGGPTLNGLFAEADLIDEWNLTVAPLLVAGGSGRAAVGPWTGRAFALDRVWASDEHLFCRHLRRRG